MFSSAFPFSVITYLTVSSLVLRPSLKHVVLYNGFEILLLFADKSQPNNSLKLSQKLHQGFSQESGSSVLFSNVAYIKDHIGNTVHSTQSYPSSPIPIVEEEANRFVFSVKTMPMVNPAFSHNSRFFFEKRIFIAHRIVISKTSPQEQLRRHA